MFSFLDARIFRLEVDYAVAQIPYFLADEPKPGAEMGRIGSSIQQGASEVQMSTTGLHQVPRSGQPLVLTIQLLASGSVELRCRDSFQQPHIGPCLIFLVVVFEKRLAER